MVKSTQTTKPAPKSTAVAVATPQRPSLIATMALKAGLEPNKYIATLRDTVMPAKVQVSNEQLAAFLSVANEYGLNPLIKEIYAFPGKGGGIVPVVSIDGWVSLINRQKMMDGMTFVDEIDEAGMLMAVTCKIYRKDRAHPTEITEYMVECRRDTDVWKKWPRRMLRHKALIQCARIAFGLSGIYDMDEAERMEALPMQIGGPLVDASSVPPAPAEDEAGPVDEGLDGKADGAGEPDDTKPKTDDKPQGEATAADAADPADQLLEDFKQALGIAKTLKALERTWATFEPRMPDDSRGQAFHDAYEARKEALGL